MPRRRNLNRKEMQWQVAACRSTRQSSRISSTMRMSVLWQWRACMTIGRTLRATGSQPSPSSPQTPPKGCNGVAQQRDVSSAFRCSRPAQPHRLCSANPCNSLRLCCCDCAGKSAVENGIAAAGFMTGCPCCCLMRRRRLHGSLMRLLRASEPTANGLSSLHTQSTQTPPPLHKASETALTCRRRGPAVAPCDAFNEQNQLPGPRVQQAPQAEEHHNLLPAQDCSRQEEPDP